MYVINIQYDNVPCQMIMFRNWTNNFKFQFQKNQSQLQEMITATVSHEMRTPINAIMTQIESLQTVLKGKREARNMTYIIKNSAQLLLYLVNDMLDVYMLKNGKFQKIEEQVVVEKLMKAVYDMFHLQMAAKRIQFQICHAVDMPDMIVSDERRLKQVLINLISNALKFTESGTIMVQSQFDHKTKLLRIDVIDTGIGIQKNDLVNLFKMFGKLKNGSK